MKFPRLFCSLMAAVFCLTMAFSVMAGGEPKESGLQSNEDSNQHSHTHGTITLYKGPHWKQTYPNDPDPDNPLVNPDIDYERGTYRDGRPFAPEQDTFLFGLNANTSLNPLAGVGVSQNECRVTTCDPSPVSAEFDQVQHKRAQRRDMSSDNPERDVKASCSMEQPPDPEEFNDMGNKLGDIAHIFFGCKTNTKESIMRMEIPGDPLDQYLNFVKRIE